MIYEKSRIARRSRWCSASGFSLVGIASSSGGFSVPLNGIKATRGQLCVFDSVLNLLVTEIVLDESGVPTFRDKVRPRVAARAEGCVGGRRKKLTPIQRADIAENVLSGRKTAAQMARLYSVSQPTVSRIVAEERTEVQSKTKDLAMKSSSDVASLLSRMTRSLPR